MAIKVVDTKRFKNEDQKMHAENEKQVCKLFQKKIKHAHIVDVLDIAVFDKSIYFVLEYVNGGELYERIKQEGRISEPQAKKWFRELIEAVAHIHEVCEFYIHTHTHIKHIYTNLSYLKKRMELYIVT